MDHVPHQNFWNVEGVLKVKIALIYIVTIPFIAAFSYVIMRVFISTTINIETVSQLIGMPIVTVLLVVPFFYIYGFMPAILTALAVVFALNSKRLVFFASIMPIIFISAFIEFFGFRDEIISKNSHIGSLLLFTLAGCIGSVFSWWITRNYRRRLIES